MIAAHAIRTRAQIRMYQALGYGKRRRRLPRQQQPDGLRKDYAQALGPFVRLIQRHGLSVRGEVLRLLAWDRWATGKMDAPPMQQAVDLVQMQKRQMSQLVDTRHLQSIATDYGHRTVNFQKQQFDRQVRAAVGVPYSAIERPIKDLVPLFASANVELIKTVPDRYFDRIAKEVQDAFENGTRAETLAETWVDVDGMAERDALRIARDQIGKLNAQINEERMTSLGIERAVWRTMNDNKVCDDCDEKDGEEFDLDDPPGGCSPGTCHPEDRCYSDPVFASILGDDE